ncbi:MAG: GGDEF domain-containing protein [Candidatus Gracilibacteria bacterium]
MYSSRCFIPFEVIMADIENKSPEQIEPDAYDKLVDGFSFDMEGLASAESLIDANNPNNTKFVVLRDAVLKQIQDADLILPFGEKGTNIMQELIITFRQAFAEILDSRAKDENKTNDEIRADLDRMPFATLVKGQIAKLFVINKFRDKLKSLFMEYSYRGLLREVVSGDLKDGTDAVKVQVKETMADLRRQSDFEVGTNSLTRCGFDRAVSLKLPQHPNSQHVVLMFDIDHFKKFNDTHGHPFGDKILKAFASILRKCIGTNGIFCRWGGEEFLAEFTLTDNFTISDLNQIVMQMFSEVREYKEVLQYGDEPSFEVGITFSCGANIGKASNLAQIGELIKVADEGLYRAKDAGRDRIDWGNVPVSEAVAG